MFYKTWAQRILRAMSNMTEARLKYLWKLRYSTFLKYLTNFHKIIFEIRIIDQLIYFDLQYTAITSSSSPVYDKEHKAE